MNFTLCVKECDRLFFSNQKNGRVKALYTGRFSYVLGVDLSDALKDYQLIVRERKLGSDELLEEFNHYQLFIWSLAGVYVNGLRWIVRALYAVTNKPWLIYDYYKARSLYFGLSYEFHEAHVGSPNIKHLNLFTLDLKIIYLSGQNSFVYLFFLLFFPLVWLIGFVITYHFTSRVCDTSSGEPKEINISKHGYVGIEKNRNMTPALKKIGKLIQIEHYLNKGNHIQWMLEKYRAEKHMWTKFDRIFKFGVTNTFDEYVNQYVRFVDSWFGGVLPRKYMIEFGMCQPVLHQFFKS